MISRAARLFRRLPASLCGCCLLALFSASCRDSESDPVATLLVPETHGAMALSVPVPSLPLLASDLALHSELSASMAQWVDSWEMDPVQGQGVRTEAYLEAGPVLAARLSDEDLESYLGTLALCMELSRGLVELDLPGAVVQAIQEAEAHYWEARQALYENRRERAVVHLLHASDAYQKVSPESVARVMVHRGQDALGRVQVSASYNQEELERADRLLRGARLALREGDPALAIRRAYYACRLLSLDLG